MKYFIMLFFVVSSTFAAEKDSVICFSKSDVTKLANKIQLLRDSVEYLQTVVTVQDTVIDLYASRTDFYNRQLSNRNALIDACQKQKIELEKINEELQPRWYDNKFLWFFGGVGTVLGIIFAVQ